MKFVEEGPAPGPGIAKTPGFSAFAGLASVNLAYADPKPNVSLTKYLMMPVWNLDDGAKLHIVNVLCRGQIWVLLRSSQNSGNLC